MVFRSAAPVLFLFPWLVCCNNFFKQADAQDFAGNRQGGEFAAFDTPQFSEGRSLHRQDLCDRYLSLNNGTMKLEDVLKGLKLNVVVGAYAGSYFNYNNETGIQPYGGIVAEIMDEVASRAGFTWRDSFGVYDVPSGGENQTWTDLLVWSTDNYDLTVDWWAKSLDRMNLGVAFLNQWYDSSIIMISKQNLAEEVGSKNEENIVWFNWMEPFTWEVWLTIVGTIVCSGFVYLIIEWLSNDRRNREPWEWLTDNMYLSSMNATQAYEYGTPRTTAAKIFGVSSGLWGLILTATYTANLASLLVTTTSDNPIYDVESIEDVTYLKYPVCTWGGTILDSHLEANHASTIRKPKLELLDVYDALNSNECLFAVDTVQGWLEHKAKSDYNPLCKLRWIGEEAERKITTIGAGFVAKADSGYKCTSLVRDVIDYHMTQLIEEGFIEKAWVTENKRKQDLDCDTFRPDLVTALDDTGGEDPQCGGRRLRQLRERRMLEEALGLQSSETNRRRRMKASSKSAASAGALDGAESDGQKMEFRTMIGSFFVHWVLMFVSLIVAVFQKCMKERKKKKHRLANYTGTAKTIERDEISDIEVEKNVNGSTHELKQQIQVLNDKLAFSNSSQTKLMEEQQELRNQIQNLSSILEQFVKGNIELGIAESPDDSSLHSLGY